MEQGYLDRVSQLVPAPAKVLDLGCGGGEPIARWFVDAGYQVTGVDPVEDMLMLCRARMPEQAWLRGDMRTMPLSQRFDVVVAWDSFFHLDANDQRAMFPRFGRWLRPGGALLFTSGPRAGEVLGTLCGDPLYHASLDPEEYESLLDTCGCYVESFQPEDPSCGHHTVWLARARED